jgi:hypothetical protein
MVGYQADVFQCVSLTRPQQLARYCLVAKQLLATSFFFSCAKCLWDAVGHFLGHGARSQHALFFGPCGACAGPVCGRLPIISNDD